MFAVADHARWASGAPDRPVQPLPSRARFRRPRAAESPRGKGHPDESTAARRVIGRATMPTSRRRPPAQEKMLGLLTGYWVSQLLYVVARLGIADLLVKGPKTAEALATATGAHAPFLHRVLRALASCGVFAEGAGGRFRLTPLAETLRSGRPGSLRDFA